MVFLKTTLAVFFLQAVTTPPAQPPRTASIEGSVVGTSGERLSKVSVTLTLNSDPSTPGGTGPRPADLPPELAQILLQSQINLQAQNSIATTVQLATTDADGKFVFDNLRAGSYRLDAARSGYVSTKYGQKGANGREMPVVLAAGQKLKDIQIAMMPAGAISGRIVDRNGEPISRVGVQAWRYRYSERGRTLALVQSVTTNDLGEYRLFWLAPGSYVVSATPPAPTLAPSTTTTGEHSSSPIGNVSVVFQADAISNALQGPLSSPNVTSRTLPDGSVAEESTVTTYYPGTVVAEQATPIAVRAGTAESGINITALPARVHKIRGLTLDGTGSPAAMTIALIPKSGGAAVGAAGNFRSNNNGTFEIGGVTTGSYYVTGVVVAATAAPSPAQPLPPAIGVSEVEMGNSDVSNVRVAASGGFTLRGHVVTEGIIQQASSSNTLRRVSLTPFISPMPSAAALVESDGSFVFQGVFPGDYQVSSSTAMLGAIDANSGSIKSVRFGGQEVGADGIHIRNQPDGEL
ncbi:MAG TPA: carboxypeptidase-like regulatory domain-containing protein, partial [Terriglobia bacterium]|nr:carboxypeptidase-like regulatory domain-containing protein [Terriglobia bacterium]